MWQLNSPVLNSAYYLFWGEMQQRLYLKNINTVDELRQRLVDVWQGMLQYVLVNAIGKWCKRLRACIRAKGGHFSAYAVTANSASITSFI